MTHRRNVRWLVALWLLVSSTAPADPGPLKLAYTRPATEWVEALPIGNGRLGAMVFGGTSEARYQFNDDTLFSGRPHDYAHAGAARFLPQLRKLLFDGRQQEAHRLANREFMSVNTRGGNRQEAYQPFGDLVLRFDGHEEVEEYARELDLDRAIASVRYRVDGVTYRREVFASHPANAIVVRLEADQREKLSFTVSLDSPHAKTTTTPVGVDTLVMDGKVEAGETRFQARLTARVNGGTSSAAEGRLEIANADVATLILTGASSFVSFRDIGGDPAARNERISKEIGETSYASLRDAHIADHQTLCPSAVSDRRQLRSHGRHRRAAAAIPRGGAAPPAGPARRAFAGTRHGTARRGWIRGRHRVGRRTSRRGQNPLGPRQHGQGADRQER